MLLIVIAHLPGSADGGQGHHDFQDQQLGGGARHAALLAGVAELAAEARRAGLHRAHQRGPPPLPRHEGWQNVLITCRLTRQVVA